MASKLGDLYVQVSSKGVTQVNTGLQQTEQRANLAANATNLLKTAIMGLGAYGVFRVFKKIIGLYIAQEKALAKLTQQLKNHNEYTQKNVDALINQAKALQEVTVFSDDQINAAQAMLASFSLTTDQIIRMTPRLLDVAVMTENTSGQMQDLATTAKMVGVALGGQPGRLTQMGIKLSDYQKKLYNAASEQEKFNLLIRIFDDNAKGLAESVGKTLDGQLKQLQHTIGDLGEEFAGEFVPTLRDLLDVVKLLTDNYGKIENFFGVFKKFSTLDMMMPMNQIGMLHEILVKLGIASDRTTESITGFHDLIARTGGGADDATGKLEELIAWLQQTGEAFEPTAAEAYRLKAAIDALSGDAMPAFSHQAQRFRGDLEALGMGIKDVTLNIDGGLDPASERYANFMSGVLLPGLYNVSNALFSGGNAWQNFANAAVDALKRIMVQMAALAALALILSKLIPGFGGFMKAFQWVSGMTWQTPRGDWWAQKEGRDFGKFFMDGFQTSFMPMVASAGSNRQQQPMNVIVHTGDPSTYVEFMRKLPTQYKSKLYRDVTIPGRALEG